MDDFDPQVGDGVTMCFYTARYPATVVRRSPKTLHVIRDRLLHYDDGMTLFESESDFERDPSGERIRFSLRAHGGWAA